ncbi:MAG: single-stranded DNA-binding protein [Patescibacteria group bacterium]|nr:single-stranded DNA-binding protein [Patescibacteria group bacterium]
MTRSLNKVMLIGNLTRDPELRYTPSGSAVCTFGIATNRQWNTDTGEKKEEVEYHRIVAWNKLGELCGQLLKKGRKVYVEGRLQTRKWQAQDGSEKTTTEVVINDMVILDSKGTSMSESQAGDFDIPEDLETPVAEEDAKIAGKKEEKTPSDQADDDIPF